MNYHRIRQYVLILAVAALGLHASIATADTKLVRPGNMNGWTIAFQTNNMGITPVGELITDPGVPPMGTGAFHVLTESFTTPPGYLYDTLQKAYIGTNLFSGISLSDITAFKYYTYVHARDCAAGATNLPGGQPPMVEIMTNSGTSEQQRRFEFKPWGWHGDAHVALDTWQEWDLMAANDGDYHWGMVYYVDSSNCLGDWNWVKTRYGTTMKLATPQYGDVYEGYGDDIALANQSGASLNIKVGAGTSAYKAWDPRTNPFTKIGTWNWWRESAGIDAYADKLLIEVNGQQFIYDFEGGHAPRVGINIKSAKDAIMTSAAAGNYEFAVFGQVQYEPVPTPNEFYLDDGSGTLIKVVSQNIAYPGEYWKAGGYIDATTTPATLICAESDIVRLD